MRKLVVVVMVLSVAALALGGGPPEFKSGLAAHYYKDPQYWGGNWPDGVSVPSVNPVDWTFTTYAYTRVEPLINHLFIRNGWFTIRWVGYIEVPPGHGNPNVPVTVNFELWMDDGARLFIDGAGLVDDWRACWEKTPESHRKATVTLAPGKHRIVVEYFQGQSLQKDDHDPAKLYWSSDQIGIPHQVVPASHFFHTEDDLKP